MGNNDMGISYIKDGLFSVSPASVGRDLWIRSCGDRNCSRRATARLGIDTLIANILVSFFLLWPPYVIEGHFIFAL